MWPTDHVADSVSGFTRNDYSRRQAFNADNSMFIAYALDGSWHVYDAKSRARLKALAGPAGDAEPRWSSTKPDVLVNSNWGVNSDTDVDAYMIELPAGTIQ